METELFQLTFNDVQLKVERFDVEGQVFFRVSFPSKEQPLTILRAEHFNGNKFWTSMPEGRQKLAEEIGILVEQYYHLKK